MHEIPLAGHFGIRKTISRIETAGFWWKKMARDIKEWIRSCNVCCRVKPDFRKHMGTMELSLDFPMEPWQVLASDLRENPQNVCVLNQYIDQLPPVLV